MIVPLVLVVVRPVVVVPLVLLLVVVPLVLVWLVIAWCIVVVEWLWIVVPWWIVLIWVLLTLASVFLSIQNLKPNAFHNMLLQITDIQEYVWCSTNLGLWQDQQLDVRGLQAVELHERFDWSHDSFVAGAHFEEKLFSDRVCELYFGHGLV